MGPIYYSFSQQPDNDPINPYYILNPNGNIDLSATFFLGSGDPNMLYLHSAYATLDLLLPNNGLKPWESGYQPLIFGTIPYIGVWDAGTPGSWPHSLTETYFTPMSSGGHGPAYWIDCIHNYDHYVSGIGSFSYGVLNTDYKMENCPELYLIEVKESFRISDSPVPIR